MPSYFKVTDTRKPENCLIEIFTALGFEKPDKTGWPTRDDVEFSYINFIFNGITLRITDDKHKNVRRYVSLRADGTIDLDHIREKYEELRILARGYEKIRETKSTLERVLYATEQELRKEIGLLSGDKLSVSRPVSEELAFDLSLRRVSADTVRKIYKEVLSAKTPSS